MERRDFLRSCGFACAGAIGLSTFLQSCKTIAYVTNTTEGNKIVVKKADFGRNKFVLVKNEKLQAPVYLLKESEEKYLAVLMLCTHKGCELNTAGDLLVCPCHGSEFSTTGKLISPPADKDLQKFVVTADLNNIYIQI